MDHPILSNRIKLTIYSLIWLVCALVQGVIASFQLNLDADIIFIDSLVFWAIFAFIGLSVWYVVYYNNLDKNPVSFVILHIITAVIAVSILVFKSWLISSFFFATRPNFNSFFESSLLLRFFIGMLSYLSMIFYYYMQIFYQKNKENKEREDAYKTLIREAELKSLKSQINPHFLFNSLNSISSQTLFDPEKAHDMIIKLSDYLRFSLSHKPDELIPLWKELDNIKRYLDIEKIRFGQRLDVKIETNESCNNFCVPTMILQPLFENAIKYGVHENTNKTTILVKSECNSSRMIFMVSNNFDPESVPSRGEGIGISNIKERLKLLYGRGDLLEINKTSDQFTVTLFFPEENAKQLKQ